LADHGGEVNRVLVPVQTSYWLALLQPIVAHIMVSEAADVAPWLRLVAYLVLFLTVGVLLFSSSYLLCRICFGVAEMRETHRRRRKRARRTMVQQTAASALHDPVVAAQPFGLRLTCDFVSFGTAATT
jgi:hypothetical protein